MRLHRAASAWSQIAEHDGPLVYDLRAERGGDKAASVAVARWISDAVQRPIEFIELADGPITDFQLSDYILPDGLSVRKLGYGEELEGLDVHTPGLGADSLWYLSTYLAMQEPHAGPSLELNRVLVDERVKMEEWPHSFRSVVLDSSERTDEILFCLLTDSKYNARRNFDLEHSRRTVNVLRNAGYKVEVLYHTTHELFPDALKLPMKEAVERLARARCVIAGDTGFSHIAAAFGTPLVALYPDWARRGMSDLTTALKVAEWWEIPAHAVVKGFYPNAPFDRLRVVEMVNHQWSVDHVLHSLANVATP